MTTRSAPGSTVTAVILSHNSLTTLRAALASVRAQTVRVGRTIVVDNGSSDGTREFLERTLPRDDLILLSTNVGVGGGHWAGWERAMAGGAEFVWALEHDTSPATDCLERLLEAYGSFDAGGPIGAVTCPEKRTRPARHILVRAHRWLRHPIRRRRRLERRRLGEPYVRDYFTFNGTLLPTAVLSQLGRPREDFFVDKEDREYAWRMASAGYATVLVPHATVDHLKSDAGGLPSVARVYYGTRNGIYMERHVERRPLAGVRAWMRLPRGLLRILLLSRSRRDHVIAKMRATSDGLGGRLGQASYPFLRHDRPGSTPESPDERDHAVPARAEDGRVHAQLDTETSVRPG